MQKLKQCLQLKLSKIKRLESVDIFSMPSKINDKDISSMFNGLLRLLKEKIQQEQCEKYLRLKLKYSRLKYLYNKLKTKLYG